MLKIARLLLFIFILFFLSIGYTKTSFAQEISNVSESNIEGEVLRTDDHRIVIQTKNNGIKEFTIPSGVKVDKNNAVTDYKNLKPGDNITLTLNQNSEVISVKSTTTSQNLENVILPILLILLLFSLLGLKLRLKPERNYIRTSGIGV